ncbi:MAG: MBOAT family protein, partial [Lachnospiraceae bacterium]|nr:MBOAT family protein [Lachnospiraceae bacterium]
MSILSLLRPKYIGGGYILVGGILYSIQLYTDFQACVCMAQGISELFGIHLVDNFQHPYFSRSVGEFWRRWHISLSSWLRDYVYIPLGGNRKGTLRKYINLTLVFIVSGMWHGAGYKYIFWGLLHAGYQIVGTILMPIRKKLYALLRIRRDEALGIIIQTVSTFTLVMLGWIIFRADRLKVGLSMIYSIFTVYNPWIFFDESLFELGLEWRE